MKWVSALALAAVASGQQLDLSLLDKLAVASEELSQRHTG